MKDNDYFIGLILQNRFKKDRNKVARRGTSKKMIKKEEVVVKSSHFHSRSPSYLSGRRVVSGFMYLLYF